MMLALAILFMASVAYGKHECIHNNHQAMVEEQVVSKVTADMDRNGDGSITSPDLVQEFITRFDINGTGMLDVDGFVDSWHEMYHDAHAFVLYLFMYFDQNKDCMLANDDINALTPVIDVDGDGQMTTAEFNAFLMKLYKDCVPVHGHGGC